MSRKRQACDDSLLGDESDIQVRTYAAQCPSGYVIRDHTHSWHQLIHATLGVMSVHTSQGAWVVPPHRAVWVPADVVHRIEMAGTVLVRTLYIAPNLSNALMSTCCAVNVSPLLRELILHAVSLEMLFGQIPAHARLVGVLLDQLEVLPTIALQLPLPLDRRAARVAVWLQQNPDDSGSLHRLAKRGSASLRTIERIFLDETGMTLGRWRQQARLLQALRLLAGGMPVTTVALRVGYDSPSAFIAMFRRVLGTTPNRYFAQSASHETARGY
jgi:AraC-like DNA-binding protein